MKSDAKDLKLLNRKVNEQIQIIKLARDTVAEKTKEFSDTQKELAESKVKIVELNKILDKFQNSQFTMNHMINSQRQAHDVRGLGYEFVPSPFNENYSFLKTDEPSTNFTSAILPGKDQLPETIKSEGVDSFLEEHQTLKM